MTAADSFGALRSVCHSKADPAKWLAARRDGFGASDIGKLCGLTPYGNADEVRAKTILCKAFPELDAFKGNANTWAGNVMADHVVTCWHDRTKYYTRVDEWETMLVRDGLPHLYVTPDWGGYRDGVRYPIEIKCVDSKVHREHWAPNDRPPKHVVAQAMFQAWMVGVDATTVVQWHWGAYPKDYTVQVDPNAIAWALCKINEAWAQVVELRSDFELARQRLLAAGFKPKAIQAVLDRPVDAPEPTPLHELDPEPEAG